MHLDEYFRIPASRRLSRKDVADQLNGLGHEITPEAIGQWVNAGVVPKKWGVIIGDLLNANEKSLYLPLIIIKTK